MNRSKPAELFLSFSFLVFYYISVDIESGQVVYCAYVIENPIEGSDGKWDQYVLTSTRERERE